MIKITGDTWDWTQFMILLFVIGIGWIILSNSVSAQNETCANESCSINESISNSNITIRNVTAVNKTTNCSEQLHLLLNTYNDLVWDYKNGTNCGTIKELLTDNNKKLSDNLKVCNKDVDKYKIYMVGFYFLFAVMIILIIYFIYMSYGHKSQEEKHE